MIFLYFTGWKNSSCDVVAFMGKKSAPADFNIVGVSVKSHIASRRKLKKKESANADSIRISTNKTSSPN